MQGKYRYICSIEIGYARVSTAKQDLDRQIDALRGEGIPARHIYVDKKSGSTTNRPGLDEALYQAREGDVVVVHTLDRLDRTVRDTLNLIHDLADRGVGVRNLADPIRVDSANPDDPMSQLAVVMLALFGQMERTYAIERAAHVRAVAAAKGKRTGRPSVVEPAKLAYAAYLRDRENRSISEIVKATGITPLQPLPSPADPTASDANRPQPSKRLKPRTAVAVRARFRTKRGLAQTTSSASVSEAACTSPGVPRDPGQTAPL